MFRDNPKYMETLGAEILVLNALQRHSACVDVELYTRSGLDDKLRIRRRGRSCSLLQ